MLRFFLSIYYRVFSDKYLCVFADFLLCMFNPSLNDYARIICLILYLTYICVAIAIIDFDVCFVLWLFTTV